MAYNLFIFTCQRSKSFACLSSLFQKTSIVFGHSNKNNLLCSLFHSSSTETISKPFLNTPEVNKYFDFIINNMSAFTKAINMNSKQSNELLSLLEKKKHIELELNNLNNMSKEDTNELKDLVEEEKQNLNKNLVTTLNEFFKSILSHEEENENRNAEIQIFSGIGGAEAKLFAHELFDMYINYAKYKNWEYFITDLKVENSELIYGQLLINGDFVYNHMKHEGGVHRVQRVPATEKTGRTHTSTCTVIVLPQPKPHEIVIKPQDVVIEKSTSSGPGGQNVNKRETAIRIKHLPTGIIVESQDTRYQYRNKEIAFERLRGKLYNMELEEEKLERKKIKKEQGGTNDYSDKIRTYHFTQNRITDHRINFSLFNVKSFILGEQPLDEMINKLQENNREELLTRHVKKILDSVEFRDFEKAKLSN